MSANVVWVGLVAFAIGCTTPISFAAAVAGIRRVQGRTSTPAGIGTAVAALVASLGASSVALVYLSSLQQTAAPVIVLPFMLGIGLVRWLRKEL